MISKYNFYIGLPFIVKHRMKFCTSVRLTFLYKTLQTFVWGNISLSVFSNKFTEEGMNFKKIVAVDETLLNEAVLGQLKSMGREVIVYHDFPTEEEEVIRRIGDADCLHLSAASQLFVR